MSTDNHHSTVKADATSSRARTAEATVIESSHYQECRDALMAETLVFHMAADLVKYHNGSHEQALSEIAHEDRGPRGGFMFQANIGYRELGGKVENRHIGAVAEVIIHILRVTA